jgi:hypothetical protein
MLIKYKSHNYNKYVEKEIKEQNYFINNINLLIKYNKIIFNKDKITIK